MSNHKSFTHRTALLGTAALALALILAGCDNEDSSNSAGQQTAAVTESEANTPPADAQAADAEDSASNQDYIAPDQKLRFNIAELESTLADIKQEEGDKWLPAFEDRVNEIYDGDEVISVAVYTADNQFHIVGYIDKNGQEGFQAEDQTVFEIVQNGEATAAQTPVTVTTYTYGGAPVYHHSSFANTFLNYWILHQLLSTPSYRYYTPPSRLSVITSNRSTFRQGPAFVQQHNRNLDFNRGTVRTLGNGGGQLTVSPHSISVPRASVPSVGRTSTPAAKTAPVYVAPKTSTTSTRSSCCSSSSSGRRK